MSFSGYKGYTVKPKPGVMLNPLHPLSRGLVSYWMFNEGGGSRANDISGHGNHGTLKNMSPNAQNSGWGGSKFGGGLKFDGVNDYVDCGSDDSLDITEAITIEAWVKFDSFPTYSQIVGTHYNDGYWFAMNNNKLCCGLEDVALYNDFKDPDALSLSIWYFIAMTYNKDGGSNNGKLYVNGNVVKQITSTNPIGSSTVNVRIGGQLHQYRMDGSIDEVRIYNRALSAEEIKILYHDPFCNLLRVPIRRYRVPMTIMNQFQRANIGADLYNGAIIA